MELGALIFSDMGGVTPKLKKITNLICQITLIIR